MDPALLDALAEDMGVGLASCAPLVRREEHARIVPSGPDRIPGTKKYTLGRSCVQSHPGVCRTRDAGILDAVLELSANFEHTFTSEHVGQYFLVSSYEADLNEVV